MKEAETNLRKNLARVDSVMEILDARLPLSSANPLLDELCKSVNRIRVLNKQDLADPEVTQRWISYFKHEYQNETTIAVTGTDKNDTWKAAEYCLKTATLQRPRRLRIMVAGIPNTGKSTIINTLAGKKVTKTGNIPAVTRQQQRTAIKDSIDIYDTPGILWPVSESPENALRLAACGSISDSAFDYEPVALFAAGYLLEMYPDNLKLRYKIEVELPESGEGLIETIGIKRGCLKKGGIIDFQKASELFIRDLRAGSIGRISLETPEKSSHSKMENSKQ